MKNGINIKVIITSMMHTVKKKPTEKSGAKWLATWSSIKQQSPITTPRLPKWLSTGEASNSTQVSSRSIYFHVELILFCKSKTYTIFYGLLCVKFHRKIFLCPNPWKIVFYFRKNTQSFGITHVFNFLLRHTYYELIYVLKILWTK
jgi:hypothetical protein